MDDLLSSSRELPCTGDVRPRVPGDKSISHRALLAAAATEGVTRISNLNVGGAITPLVKALQTLGASVRVGSNGDALVGPLPRAPSGGDAPVVNLGPSSAAARVLLGVLAGLGLSAIVDGDASLRPRPISWVVEPLAALGAQIEYLGGHGQLPVRLRGGRLHGGRVKLTVGSAQARAAVLFAAFAAGVEVELEQPLLSRDHAVRLLRHLGADIQASETRVRFSPGPRRAYVEHAIPGDPSAAAYVAAAHVLSRRPGEIRIEGLCLNPTRTGFFEVLRRSGAGVRTEEVRESHGEPVGTLVVGGGTLSTPVRVIEPSLFHALIDEVPLTAAVATQIPGTSEILNAQELVFKETNRLVSTRDMLRAFGARVTSGDGWLRVEGGVPLGACDAPSYDDHRLAMAAATLGCALPGSTRVLQGGCHRTSFPEFPEVMRGYGFDVGAAPRRDAPPGRDGGAA